jgi:cytochrome c
MFDTMTATKTVGAVCGALLVFLLGNWAATSIYAMGSGGHGAEGESTQAYTIDTGAAAPAEDAPTIDVAAVLAAGDAAAGEKVFGKCKACHSVEGKDGTGPHLNGVVGREIASVGGFEYSESMKAHAGTPWSPEALFGFLENPKAFAADTKMKFSGLPKPEERANVIAYLATKP